MDKVVIILIILWMIPSACFVLFTRPWDDYHIIELGRAARTRNRLTWDDYHTIEEKTGDIDWCRIASMERPIWGITFHHDNPDCCCDSCLIRTRESHSVPSPIIKGRRDTQLQTRPKSRRRLNAYNMQHCLFCGWEGYSDYHQCKEVK